MATQAAETETERAARIKSKWNERCKTSGMNDLFEGTGYITIGYYKTGDESLGASAKNMTARLAEISGMDASSHVLDLGCGRGRPLLDTAVALGCSVVGVDLAEGHIEMAKESIEVYREKKPDLKAEFYCNSYLELPESVTSQKFSHIMMQTSLFYSHHRIDEIFVEVSKLLKPGGIFVASDFVRVAPESEIEEFMKFNSMPVALSLDEMKAAFLRHGMEYSGGENLDSHCIKCNAAKVLKVTTEKIEGPNVEFFRNRENSVRDGKVSFQIIMAKKN